MVEAPNMANRAAMRRLYSVELALSTEQSLSGAEMGAASYDIAA